MPVSLKSFVKESSQTANLYMRSVMVQQHGQITGEHFWLLDERRNIHSITKSITSCGVGIALQQGYFSLQDKVVSYFEKDIPKSPDPRLLKMTIGHFLTMTAGFETPMHGEFRKATIENFPAHIFNRPIAHEPGKHFSYDTSCSYIIGAILQKAIGISLKSFIFSNILEPIGILNPPWPESREGVCLGGSGIMLDTPEMVALGQFWLQAGAWDGKQIVPVEYFHKATTTINISDENSEMTSRGYGYYFWTDLWKDRFPKSFHAVGSWGKYIFVIPEKQTVIAVTAHDPTPIQTAISGTLERLVEHHILPQL